MPTLVEEPLDRITLYYREGSSDKVYQCAIEAVGTRFAVNFAYGRRGTTLNTGTKTNVPVDYDDAKRIYDKLVHEKTGKGYTEGPNGTPYQNAPKEERFTGLLPQLLNPIDETEVNRLLAENVWILQEKFDGRRLLVKKESRQVTGINRKGLVVGLPQAIIESAQAFQGDFVMDGESIGDEFFVFDLLSLNAEDLRPQPYRERLVRLMNLFATAQQQSMTLVSSAFSTEQKHSFLEELRAGRREGVVFKRLDAPYTPGRPNSGGPQLKHKFYATASLVVAAINDKRSVELRLIHGDGWRVAGNVTIPPNHPIPKVGAVIDAKYLYAFPESGCLYQPVYLGERSDIEPWECTVSQLKFKAGDEDES